MVGATIGAISLCWLIYNGWRVYSAPVNAIEIGADVRAVCPRDFAYQTYMNIGEFYLRLSPGHKKYEMIGTELLKDVMIHIWETAGFQFVRHQYRVAELVPGELMGLVSEKSQVEIWGLFNAESRSEVKFVFHPAGDGQTNLRLTIRIVFPNRFRHLLSRLFFTEAIWQSHARAEMNALAEILEQRYRDKQENRQPSRLPRLGG
jgi:hypothetical protein